MESLFWGILYAHLQHNLATVWLHQIIHCNVTTDSSQAIAIRPIASPVQWVWLNYFHSASEHGLLFDSWKAASSNKGRYSSMFVCRITSKRSSRTRIEDDDDAVVHVAAL